MSGNSCSKIMLKIRMSREKLLPALPGQQPAAAIHINHASPA